MTSQRALTIAYQGEPGAYSQAAAQRLFPGATAVGFPAFSDVFEAVESGAAARAVVPVENAIFGGVHPVYDLLPVHQLRIVHETWERVRHCLLALPGVSLADIREVRSHPQALGQCAVYLRTHLPEAAIVQVHDTAGAARHVREKEQRDVAAIASGYAADLYGLSVLAEGIETYAGNFTRFLVLVRAGDAPPPPAEGSGKTTVSFSVFPGLPDALYRCFAAFGKRRFDLLRAECRPRAGHPLQHTYVLDVAGSEADPLMQEALGELRRWADAVRVLGSYPVAV